MLVAKGFKRWKQHRSHNTCKWWRHNTCKWWLQFVISRKCDWNIVSCKRANITGSLIWCLERKRTWSPIRGTLLRRRTRCMGSTAFIPWNMRRRWTWSHINESFGNIWNHARISTWRSRPLSPVLKRLAGSNRRRWTRWQVRLTIRGCCARDLRHTW